MKKQQGFTLIELLVVIAIIGILASVILASLNSARLKARDAKRMSDLHEIQIALESYYNDNGFYPPCNVSGQDACTTTGGSYPPMSAMLIVPQYISSISNDPTNIATQYGYYYTRGFKITGPGITYVQTGSKGDYILGTRLENPKGGPFPGWDNNNLNYLIGN
ncbi:MAG: fimbrial protein pilin [Candidatus Nomurabacteria bacterium]|nr:fimbrial protein pilin [Candidatus Nomurabacteria bacterium]